METHLTTTNSQQQLQTSSKPKEILPRTDKQAMLEVMQNNGGSLFAMRRESSNPDSVVKLVAGMLMATQRRLNLDKLMSAEAMNLTAEDIMAEYGGLLSLQDIALCLRRAEKGKFGDIYRINEPVIMKWFAAYSDERMALAEEESMRQHQINKNGGTNEVLTDEKLRQLYAMERERNLRMEAERKQRRQEPLDLEAERRRQQAELEAVEAAYHVNPYTEVEK